MCSKWWINITECILFKYFVFVSDNITQRKNKEVNQRIPPWGREFSVMLLRDGYEKDFVILSGNMLSRHRTKEVPGWSGNKTTLQIPLLYCFSFSGTIIPYSLYLLIPLRLTTLLGHSGIHRANNKWRGGRVRRILLSPGIGWEPLSPSNQTNGKAISV